MEMISGIFAKDPSYLFTTTYVTRTFKQSLKIGIKLKGNEVVHVKSGSPAATKGIKAGWTVIKVNGKTTRPNTADIVKAIELTQRLNEETEITFSKTSKNASLPCILPLPSCKKTYRSQDVRIRAHYAQEDIINSRQRKLRVSKFGYTDTEVEVVAKELIIRGSLAHLILSHNNIGNRGVKMMTDALKKNSTITQIDLRGNSKITEESAVELVDVIFETEKN